MELNKKTMQRIMLLIAFAVLLFWGLYNISAVTKVLGNLLDLLSPLLMGICIAFVLNLLLSIGEKKAKAATVEKAPQAAQAAQRRKGPKKGAPALAQKASGSLHRPPRPGRGRGRIPPRVEPPKSRQKDSTEQQSLMKPFYIEHD